MSLACAWRSGHAPHGHLVAVYSTRHRPRTLLLLIGRGLSKEFIYVIDALGPKRIQECKDKSDYPCIKLQQSACTTYVISFPCIT